jgi:hypothetical protein
VALTLVGVLWWRTTGLLDREISAVIVADTRAVGDRLSDFGLGGAIETINDRIHETSDEHAVYLLTDPMRTPVAGNLEAWPIQVDAKPGWYTVPLVRGKALHQTRILNVMLTNGFHLLVGRDIQDRAALEHIIVGSLTWTAFIALVLAVAGGLLVRYSILKRVGALNMTADAIVRGDLTQRLQTPGPGDEFDQLAATINGMLDQIQLLLEGARTSSNTVAHNLRTPLAELRTRLESIVRDRPKGNDAITQVEDAIADTDRIIDSFNALLRLAEIKSGVRRAGFRKVEIAPIVRDVIELYAPMAEEKKLKLTIDVPDDLSLQGDPNLLAQALSNLVDNALKYSSEGTVALTARAVDSDHIEMRIADQGPGIPETEKDQIGQRFRRGSGKEGIPGYGLGLSIVDAIARLHGGSLKFGDNHPGVVASLVLAANLAHPQTPSPPRAHPGASDVSRR